MLTAAIEKENFKYEMSVGCELAALSPLSLGFPNHKMGAGEGANLAADC